MAESQGGAVVSKPKRYDLIWSEMIDDAVIGVTENGDYVRYADYAALKAEVERLSNYLDSIDLAFGKANQEQVIDTLIDWRKSRNELP
jgi:hypothetical protein